MTDLATKICHAVEQRSDDVNVEMRARVQTVLDAALAELRADKSRLDWLIAGGAVLVREGERTFTSTLHYRPTRGQIDLAMLHERQRVESSEKS